MGWLGAALQTGTAMLGGRAAGQNQGILLQRQLRQEDEDRKAKATQTALQAALLHSQIGLNERRSPEEWKPTSMEEYQAVHPVAPRNLDPNDPEVWKRRTEAHEADRRFDASHPIPSGADGEPDFDPGDPKNHMKILNAYMQHSGQGHQDPESLQWVPPPPPEQRIKDAEVAYQEMVRLTSPGGVLPPEGSVTRNLPSHRASTEPLSPAAPPPPPEPGAAAGKRVITQDQMEFLQAHNRWDPSLYEVR